MTGSLKWKGTSTGLVQDSHCECMEIEEVSNSIIHKRPSEEHIILMSNSEW